MEILIDVACGHDDLDERDVCDLALFTLTHLDLPDTTEVSISFVDTDTMASLNELYRGIAGPTDVLSFECDNIDDGFPAGDAYELGDIVISCAVAERQSQEIGWSFMEEIELLVIHGLLHLDGYDHIDDDDAALMEQKQTEIHSLWRSRTAHQA